MALGGAVRYKHEDVLVIYGVKVLLAIICLIVA